jgi:hypothetical protein
MTSRSLKFFLKPFSVAICSAVVFTATLSASAQTESSTVRPQPRITAPITNSSRLTLVGSRPPRANSAEDAGPVSPTLNLHGISLVFSRSTAQQAALDGLIAAQQNPSSPLYHRWLTPTQFAAQFGVADADIAAAETWLQQEGFSIDGVSRSRNRIYFSGTAAQVASAFGTSLHNYTTPVIGNQPAATHFAPSTDLTLPSALASSVLSVDNLSSFRPHPHVKIRAAQAAPRYTSSQTGENFLTPADVDTIYDVNPAISAGYTGSGQTIVIIGQSAIETADLSDFQTAAGLPAKLPNLILMPGTGASTINPGGSTESDEVESDLDLEYSDAIAQGATIDFIYTGSNTNYGAFDALQYAVDNQATYPASIISSSYGECEPALGSASYNSLNAVLEQAASQGQTVIAAAGDDGSTDCNGEYSSSDTVANEQLAVDFPGSSQYVTSMGGTEFLLADIVPGSSYFDTKSTADIISSARSYIPEQVWNDDAGDVSLGAIKPSPIASGGGGVSIYTARPSWQTGVPGIPTSGNRVVPDLALYASSGEPDVSAKAFYGGFLFCSSDNAATGVTGSCSHGFRDTSDEYFTIAGGTSFDAPIFSGMLAIINQAKGYTAASGQGIINPALYTLAANSTTYASAFHDITSGGNECAAGTKYCGTGAETTDYLTTTGYDEASGLGSVDLYNLLSAWPGTSATTAPAASTTTLSAATATPVAGANDVITITVASWSSSAGATPTGTLSISVDGSIVASSIELSGGSAQYSFSSTTLGSHVIEATYSGDANYEGSSGSITITVGAAATVAESFSLSATNVTVAAGSSGTSTITITPAGGYTGTIDWTIGLNAIGTALANACYTISNTTVSGSAPVTTTLTVLTSSSACSNVQASDVSGGKHAFVHSSPTGVSGNTLPEKPFPPSRAAFLISGLLFACIFSRKSRKIRPLTSVLILATLAAAVTGCSGSSSPASTNAAQGTYSLTITGTDSANSSITASTGITLTID